MGALRSRRNDGRGARVAARLVLLLTAGTLLLGALLGRRPSPETPRVEESADPRAPPASSPGARLETPPRVVHPTHRDAVGESARAPSASVASGASARRVDLRPVSFLVTGDGEPLAGAEVRVGLAGAPRTLLVTTGGELRGVTEVPVRLAGGAWAPARPDPFPPDPTRSAIETWSERAPIGLTDASGTATARLPSADYEVSAFRDDGSHVWIGEVAARVRDGDEAPVRIEVRRAPRVRGVVRDEGGAGLPGVHVRARAASDAGRAHVSAPVTTDRDGRFTLIGFGDEPHVLCAYGRTDSPPVLRYVLAADGRLAMEVEEVVWDEVPAPALDVPPCTVTVAADDLARVEIVLRPAESLCLMLTGLPVSRLGFRSFRAFPSDDAAWLSNGAWPALRSPIPDPVYVPIPPGAGCPWFVLRPEGAAPVVGARTPGGLRAVRLEPGRRVSGFVTKPDHGVRAFLRMPNGDRVEFDAESVGHERYFEIEDAPTSAFDLAAYDGDRRTGPWLEVPPGKDDPAGIDVGVDADVETAASETRGR